MTDDVLNPGETRPMAPVIDMIATPPKKPYPEMSNSEKLAELQHKDAIISVLRHTIAEQEIALETSRNDYADLEAKHTRFSRVIHANACLEIGARVLSEDFPLDPMKADITDSDLDGIAAIGARYADAIQRTLEKKPDSDAGLTGVN